MAAISKEIPSFQTSIDNLYSLFQQKCYIESSQFNARNNRSRIGRFFDIIDRTFFSHRNFAYNFIGSPGYLENLQEKYRDFSSYCRFICQKMNGFLQSSYQIYQNMIDNNFLNL